MALIDKQIAKFVHTRQVFEVADLSILIRLYMQYENCSARAMKQATRCPVSYLTVLQWLRVDHAFAYWSQPLEDWTRSLQNVVAKHLGMDLSTAPRIRTFTEVVEVPIDGSKKGTKEVHIFVRSY